MCSELENRRVPHLGMSFVFLLSILVPCCHPSQFLAYSMAARALPHPTFSFSCICSRPNRTGRHRSLLLCRLLYLENRDETLGSETRRKGKAPYMTMYIYQLSFTIIPANKFPPPNGRQHDNLQHHPHASAHCSYLPESNICPKSGGSAHTALPVHFPDQNTSCAKYT